MMRQYELVERVLRYAPNANEALLNRAYVYAMKAHGNQKRASGDPYFSHPLEVAAILTELKLDDATIAAALLHDVIEDTDVTRAEIDQMFGKEIGELVDGLTKIKKLDLVTKKAEQAENFRKLLLAISSDIRVLLIKLADRLHNMRTLEHKKPESRRRTADETLEIYAPLAGRMGMQEMREELEALAFKWGYADVYRTVMHKLNDIHVRNAGIVGDIVAQLQGQAHRGRGGGAGLRPREEAVLDLAQDGEPADLAGAALRYLRLPRRGGQRRRLLSRARRGARLLARRAGALQGLHLDAQAEQLPVDPHHHRRPAPPARGIADPHRGDASHRRVRRGGARAL